MQPQNLSQLCRALLVLHREVQTLIFAAMMPDLSPADIKRLKWQESFARQERKRFCRLIRDEVRLRLAAWEAGRPYSQTESTSRQR